MMPTAIAAKDQPAQQHLARWAQQSAMADVSNINQTALAEARLEAYLTLVNPNSPCITPRWIQQTKNTF